MQWRFLRHQSNISLDQRLQFLFKRGFSKSARSELDIASVVALARSDTIREGRKVVVKGSVRTIRNQKRIAFAKIGDGSTTEELQAILDPSQAKGISTGTAVSLTGSLRPCPPGLQQSHELVADAVEVV